MRPAKAPPDRAASVIAFPDPGKGVIHDPVDRWSRRCQVAP